MSVGQSEPDLVGVARLVLRTAMARGASPSSVTLVNATEAERLAGRVDDFHGALDPIAQNSRTTSVTSTREGVDIISSGGRDRC